MRGILLPFIFGTASIRGEYGAMLRFAGELCRKNVPFSRLRADKDGISLRVMQSSVKAVGDTTGFSVEYKGLPTVFAKYKKRIGLFIGAILGICAVIVSGKFVWSIEVVGNEYTDTEEIEALVSRFGLYEGALKSNVDIHWVALNAELEDSRIAWLSVNYFGTHAIVEMREVVPVPEIADKSIATNLVAKTDGQIIYVEAQSGYPSVHRYDVVQKGDILISGIGETKKGGYRTTRSVGKVIAKTSRIFEVTVPFETDEKRFTGNASTSGGISILGLDVDFGKTKDFAEYDTVESKSKLTLFSCVTLPVTVISEKRLEYVTAKRILTPDEAVFRATEEIGELIRSEIGSGEVLSKEVSVRESASGVTVTVVANCIEDICTENIIGGRQT